MSLSIFCYFRNLTWLLVDEPFSIECSSSLSPSTDVIFFSRLFSCPFDVYNVLNCSYARSFLLDELPRLDGWGRLNLFGEVDPERLSFDYSGRAIPKTTSNILYYVLRWSYLPVEVLFKVIFLCYLKLSWAVCGSTSILEPFKASLLGRDITS